MKKRTEEHVDVMYRIKRGLCGYVSYLAACEMNQAFSEYVLYEPILRIMTAQGFIVHCEHKCPGVVQTSRGDKKRLDFYATGSKSRLAIEVKWLKSKSLSIDRDIEKLKGVLKAEPETFPLLLLFGKKSLIENTDLAGQGFKEAGKAVYADLRKTKYGCRVFRYAP